MLVAQDLGGRQFLCEFGASLVYTGNSSTDKTMKRNLASGGRGEKEKKKKKEVLTPLPNIYV